MGILGAEDDLRGLGTLGDLSEGEMGEGGW